MVVLYFQKHNTGDCPLLKLPAANLPQSVKYSESILELKTKMKDLGNIDCSRILCR